MIISRRHLAAVALLATGMPAFVLSSAQANEADVAAVTQAVAALTKAMLTADKARTLTIYVDGSQRSLSTKTVAPGPERYGRFELTKGRLAYLSEIPFTYNIRADRETGALLTLQ